MFKIQLKNGCWVKKKALIREENDKMIKEQAMGLKDKKKEAESLLRTKTRYAMFFIKC